MKYELGSQKLPLHAKDPFHLWQQALSAVILEKYNQTFVHLALSSITTLCERQEMGATALILAQDRFSDRETQISPQDWE